MKIKYFYYFKIKYKMDAGAMIRLDAEKLLAFFIKDYDVTRKVF